MVFLSDEWTFRHEMFMCRRLGTWTFMHRDFYVPEAKKVFFSRKKFFKNFFPQKSFPNKAFFPKTFFSTKKRFSSQKDFFF